MNDSLINLRYSDLSFNEAVSSWENCYKGYQKAYEHLIRRFPNMIVELKLFYCFVSDKIFIEDISLFDFCLCRAMNQYQLWSKKSKFQGLEVFRKTLFVTARQKLKGLKVQDPTGTFWTSEQNISFQTWLDEQPLRISFLQQEKLMLMNSPVKAA